MRSIRRLMTTLFFSLALMVTHAQDFEGYIVYKVEPTFQLSGIMDKQLWDSMMVDMFGPDKSFIKKYYYKAGKYMSAINTLNESGYELYNQTDSLVYGWQKHSDTAITKNLTKTIDQFISLTENKGIDTILGIPCKSITLKTFFGTSTFWYNPSWFQINASHFESHIYGSLNRVFKHMNCLPVKIETVGREGPNIQTAISYKQEKIPDSLFILPGFKVINPHPIN